jgi:hypothetical protein
VVQSKYAATKADLARKLGISYYTLVTKYWRREGRPKDHAPGRARYDVQAYKDWISGFKYAHNFGQGHNGSNNGYHFNERERALIEEKKIRAESARFDLEVKRGEWISRIEAFRDIETSDAIVIRELKKGFEHTLPPKLDMVKASEARKILCDWFDTMRRYMPGMILQGAKNNS